MCTTVDIKTLITALSLREFHLADDSRAVIGGYCGDLLSWVMGRAPMDGAWMTIMSNVNVAAVAALTDVSCVILTEGVTPDAPLLQKASAQGINLLGTDRSTYDCAAALATLLN